MRLQDLAKFRGASPQQILEACEHALNIQESEDPEFDVSGAQSITNLLSKLSISKEGTPFQRLTAGALLAQLVTSAGKKKPDVAKVLLQSSYASSLCTLTTAAVVAARKAEIPFEQSCMNIAELLKAIADAGSLSYKENNSSMGSSLYRGKRVRGRSLIGEHAVPALVDALLLINDVHDDDIYHTLPCCTLATEFLVILVQSSPSNCLALASAQQLDDGKALASVIQRSGNFSIQLDISEIIYYCFVAAEDAKNNHKDTASAAMPAVFPELKGFPLSAPLKNLASRDMQEMNFPKELRDVVMRYNTNLKNLARVLSLSAKEIKIDGDFAIMPAGKWVDFGTTSLTLNLILDAVNEANKNHQTNKNIINITSGNRDGSPNNGIFSQDGNFNLTPADAFGSQSQPDENDASHDEAMPALEEIFYSDMTGVKFSVRHDGTTAMEISLPRLSQDLIDAGYGSKSASEGKNHLILITFHADDLAKISSTAPKVAKAIQSAGISLPSVRAVNAGSGGGGGGAAEADTSQRPKKVSIAVAPVVSRKVQNVSGLRKPLPKDTVYVQMERMKNNTNHTTSGITHVSRNAPAQVPVPVPAVAAAAPVAAHVEDAKPPVKRQWKRTKRGDANDEKSAPVIPTKPNTKKKEDETAVPSAAENPEKTNKNTKVNAPTTKKKGRSAGKKAAATKKAVAAPAPAPAAATHKKTKAGASGDPIEDTTLLDATDAVQNQSSPVNISDQEHPLLEDDALPDWMNEAAAAAPAPSPVFKSQYAVASPQLRASPFDESSDDEDDEFAVNTAFIKAAAEEKAAAGIAAAAKKVAIEAAKPPAAHNNTKLAAVAYATTDPYQLTTKDHPTKDANKKSKVVSAAQKPRAVATKRQAAATKKKPAAVAGTTAVTSGKKKKNPAAKKLNAASTDDINAGGGRKQPRRAAATQAAEKTKKQLNAQSIDLKDDNSSDDDGPELKTNGVYGDDGGFLYKEDGSDDEDGWGVPLTQVPPSRVLLEDDTTTTSNDEDVGHDSADGENGGHHNTNDDYNYDNEYSFISQNISPSAARHGAKDGVAGLKAALAGTTTTRSAAAGVLRKRVTPPSASGKKGKGRLSNMMPVGGGGSAGGGATREKNSGDGGAGSDGVKKRKAQPVGQKKTPGKLQTETPAGDAGKKRDAVCSEEPKTKTVSKAAKAALVAGAAAAQKQRADAGIKKKAVPAVIQLESNTASEDEEQDNLYEDFIVAEKQQKRAPVPAPATAAAKKKPAAAAAAAAAAKARVKTGAAAAATKKRSAAAAAMWDTIDIEELLEEDEEENEVNVKPVIPAATRTAPGRKNINTNYQAVTKAVNFDNDVLLNQPDEYFEIILDSEDEEQQQAAVAGPRGGRGGRKKNTVGARGDTAAFLQMLQGRLGGANTNLDSEDEDDDDDDDDDAGFGSSDFVHVQAALAQAMANSKRKAQRARAAQVNKLEKETKAELFNVQNEVQADVTAAEAKAAEVLAAVEEKLMETEEEIRGVQAKYEVKMTELSEKQRVLAAEADRVGQEAARYVSDAKNRGKRKLNEAFAAVKEKLEEGKRRIQRAAKRAKRIPDLASLLVPLFASG